MSLIKKLIVATVLLVVVGALIFHWYAPQSNTATNEPVVVENKEKESEVVYTERYRAQVDRVAVVFEQEDYTSYRLTTNGLVREGELNTERGYKTDEDATVYVLDWQKPEGEQIRYVRLTEEPGRLYLLDTNNEMVLGTPLILEIPQE